MMLRDFVSRLNEYLKVDEWSDVSVNGLQVEGSSEVKKVAFAVDACMDVFKVARDEGVDAIVVHHGIIWGGIERVKGLVAKRVKFLLENGISLYAAHLPLDAHEVVGNNVILLSLAGFKPEKRFGHYKGKAIGFSGSSDRVYTIFEVVEKIEKHLGCKTRVFDFGGKITKAGAVSGRGAFAIEEAYDEGLDLLITGEAEHSAYHVAKELGINVIFAGHYATETLGVKALMNFVRGMGLDVVFVDMPTGL